MISVYGGTPETNRKRSPGPARNEKPYGSKYLLRRYLETIYVGARRVQVPSEKVCGSIGKTITKYYKNTCGTTVVVVF